jgi:hypothetical protein
MAHFFLLEPIPTSSDILYALSNILGHSCGLIDLFIDDDDDENLLLLLHLSSAMVVASTSAPDFSPSPPEDSTLNRRQTSNSMIRKYNPTDDREFFREHNIKDDRF